MVLLFVVIILLPLDAVAKEKITIRLSEDQQMDLIWIPDLKLWAGEHVVTLGQYMQISKEAARYPERFSVRDYEGVNPKDAPAVKISWNDAMHACRILNQRHRTALPSDFVFRLPTEEEWEAMARAGDDRKYPWGDSWPPTVMIDGVLPNLQGEEMIPSWKKHHSNRVIENYEDGWASLAPVRKSGANEWGIYGLAGNAREWCEGWYDEARKLRLMKGSSAYSYNSGGTEIAWRGKVDGQSAVRGWFIWGTIRNQGNVVSGFRVVAGRPATE